MKQKLFLLFWALTCLGIESKAESLLYEHSDLHLFFTINTDTKTAILGDAFSSRDHNAICLPPMSDPWWDENPPTNYWKDLDIPSTIICEGIGYTYDSDIKNIEKDTYTVVSINSKAFYKSTYVQTVKLPESITAIGANAFGYCIYLTSITLPSQLSAIGEGTFYYCKKLESIQLPAAIQTIGSSSFSDCILLEEIRIPGNCTSIGDDAFTGCSALHKIIIDDGIDTLNVGSSFAVSLSYYPTDPNGLDAQPHQRGLFADCNIDSLYLGRNIKYPYGFDWKTTTSSNWTKITRPFPPFEKCSEYRLYIQNYYYSGFTLNSLEFGETLTDIPDSLFAVTNIKCEISLPSKLKKIGKRSFYCVKDYSQSGQIEIPQSVESIGEEAFSGNYISEVIFHEGLQKIGNKAFYDNKITSLTIPSTITTYGKDPFGKNKITSLSLTDGLKSMCSISDAQIVELIIPESMETIGGDFGTSLRFVYCKPTTPLESSVSNNPVVYVPAGTRQLYREHGWNNIVDPSDIQININVKTAGTLYSRILNQAECQLNDVYRLKLKGTLNADDWSTIDNMNFLYDLDLSELSLEYFPSGFFQNKTNLNKISLPNIQSIEENAFSGCVHLKGLITIPASCTSVGTRAFYGLNINGLLCEGNTSIQDEAFMNCSMLNDVILASGMTIGAKAFHSTAIEELSIPAYVTIDDNAFNTTTLKTVTFNGDGQSLGDNVFSNSVEKFTFNGALESIGSFATSVETIDVNDIITWCKMPFTNPVSINQLTIDGAEAHNIVIPDDINSLRENLFYDCPTIESVQLPDDITEIPNQAFKGCVNLSTVTLPANLEAIGSSAFLGCSSLQGISLPSKLETLGSNSFEGCINLSQVDMPSSLTLIDDFTFKGCSSLNNVELSKKLLTIGEGAFSGCSALEKIDFPVSVTSIGENVFQDCTNLDLVIVHWKEPITVNNISGNCFLYVPIGTSQKYINAGWNFSNMKERGILTFLVTGNGNVEYDSEVISNQIMDYYFKPYSYFTVRLVPDSGYKIVKATLNGENIIQELSDGEYEIDEPEEDLKLIVVFDDASIEQGDVNADRVFNATDATEIANYILKRAPEQFRDYWADVNGDGVIDITDIIIVISKFTSGQ